MSKKQIALYARVSTEQQAQAGTIESQIQSVLQLIKADNLTLEDSYKFIDDGYSGTTLVRPALERLRDAAHAGLIDRLYVHSPDRLSRKYAYQILLVDEFHKSGIDIIFQNSPRRGTPEDELLLQVQGMMAEYERAKFLERSRRGRLHAAKRGCVSVFGSAPYGYRYITKKSSAAGEAHFVIEAEEAKTVQQVFQWFCVERTTITEVCRRLQEAGIKTRKGRTVWTNKTIYGMLKNPAYTGNAAYGRTRIGPRRKELRAKSSAQGLRTHDFSLYRTSADDWIRIPVPPLISSIYFDIAQQQLDENRRFARARFRGSQYLLQGLIYCNICRRAYYGKPVWCARMEQRYFYYRCRGSDKCRLTEQSKCANKQIRREKLEDAVFEKVRSTLQSRFAAEVAECVDWDAKRKLLRAVVERVAIDKDEIVVVFRKWAMESNLEASFLSPKTLEVSIERSLLASSARRT